MKVARFRDLVPKDRYYYELGLFVQHFSKIETLLQYALWFYSDTSEQTARAVFSGVRVEQAVSFIKRLHRSKDIEMHPLLSASLDQIGVINAARNLIVHYGARFEDDLPKYVTNARSVLKVTEALKYPISSHILSGLTRDLVHIQFSIGLVLGHAAGPIDDFEDRAERLLRYAWRYKHEPEGTPRQPTKRKPRKHANPPEPSRA